MLELTRFELKKIVTRRTTLVTCIVIFAAMCAIMGLNIIQAYYVDKATDTTYTGLEAIAHERDAATAHAGTLATERIAEDITAYQQLVLEKASPEELVSISGQAAYQLMSDRCTNEELAVLYDSYYSTLLSPWHSTGNEPYQTAAYLIVSDIDPASYYDVVSQNTQATLALALDPASEANVHYSQAEHDMWEEEAATISTPYTYDYFGGWEDIINCVAFLVFPMFAVCVALAPVFSAEYTERTDSVLLSARWGRNKLVAAKILASFLFATVFFALCAAVVVIVPLVCYGAGGAEVSIQCLSTRIPYALTMSQAAAITVGLAYAFTLGVAGLTLALSSRLRSQIAIFAVIVVLLLLTGMIGSGGNEVLARILNLFPLQALSVSLFSGGISYGLGPVALTLVEMIAVVWVALAVICTPFAAASFRRHQVV